MNIALFTTPSITLLVLALAATGTITALIALVGGWHKARSPIVQGIALLSITAATVVDKANNIHTGYVHPTFNTTDTSIWVITLASMIAIVYTNTHAFHIPEAKNEAQKPWSYTLDIPQRLSDRWGPASKRRLTTMAALLITGLALWANIEPRFEMPAFQVLSLALAAIALITSFKTNRSSRITERLGRTLTQKESLAEDEQHQFSTDIRTQWFSAATFGTAATLVIAALGYERATGGSELLPNEWTVTTMAICTLAGVASMGFRFSHLGKKILQPRKLHPTIVAQMAFIAMMIGSMAATNINPMAVILVPITTAMASIAALWGAIHDSRKPPPINPDEESQTIPIATPE